MAIIDLGLLQAQHTGTEPPQSEKLLWYDENPSQRRHKYFDMALGQWLPLSRGTFTQEINAGQAYPLDIAHQLGDPYPQAFGVASDGTRHPLTVLFLDEDTLRVLAAPAVDYTLLVRT